MAARRVYALSTRLPADERFALTDQVRRSSRAVGALIAEAWARRQYRAAFIEKLSQAQAEAMETQVWLEHACGCGLIDKDQFAESDAEWQQIGGMLQRMIEKASSFKPKNRP